MFFLPFGLILCSKHSSLCVMGMACYVCCWFHPFSCWLVTMCFFIVLIFACCWFWKSFVKWVWYLCDLLLSLVYVLKLAYGIGLLCFYDNIMCEWWHLESIPLKQLLFLNVVSHGHVLYCGCSDPSFWNFMWSILSYPFLMFECFLCMHIMVMVNCLIDSSGWICLSMLFCTITILLHLSYCAP